MKARGEKVWNFILYYGKVCLNPYFSSLECRLSPIIRNESCDGYRTGSETLG